jgi:hypothetical protein
MAARMNENLKQLRQDMDRSAERLKGRWVEISRDARDRALKVYEDARAKADDLEARFSMTMISLKAAVNKGAEEFEAQRKAMEAQAEEARQLRELVERAESIK